LTASSADEALALARSRSGRIDLLLTDATMPGQSGIELAQKLLAQRPGIALIVMSGNLEVQADLQPLRGRAELLPKPFTPNELRARVRQALDRESPGL
jgi:DNA-binding response OmpR family regulator